MTDPAATLAALTLRNARLRGDEAAILFEGRTITHRAFAEKACRLAQALIKHGVKRGDRVAILAQNGPEYMAAYAAGELGGWATVTLNYRLAPAEIAYIVADSRPRVIICEHAFLDRLSDAARAAIEHIVTFGGPGPDLDYETVSAKAAADVPEVGLRGDDIAFIIFTSGTTGRPKGVMLSHAGQVQAALISALEAGVRPTDRFALATPLYHIGAKNLWLMNAVMGATIILDRAFRAAAFYDSVRAHEASATLLAPTMLSDLLEETDASAATLPAMKRIMYSAAPMPEPLLRKALARFGSIFTQIYGMTESGGPGCVLYAHQHDPDGPPHVVRRLASAGQPMVETEVRIIRTDGTFAATGETGEIVIRGPALMRGYWNNDAATKEALAGGWLHTGDAGHEDEHGFIYLVDRIKDMIVSGGENIYSREVENALLGHPAVLECAVVGGPHPRWGEQVVAFVVRRPGMDADEAALIAHCRNEIAAYKRPQQVHFIESLPRLPNGKIEKYKLRAPLWAKGDGGR